MKNSIPVTLQVVTTPIETEINPKEKPQFSKVMTAIVLIMGIVLIVASIVLCFFGLDSISAAAILGVGGTITMTIIIAYMKKSQAENLIKIQMGMYKEILSMKTTEERNEIIDGISDTIVNKMENTVDTFFSDAASPIERQDVDVM